MTNVKQPMKNTSVCDAALKDGKAVKTLRPPDRLWERVDSERSQPIRDAELSLFLVTKCRSHKEPRPMYNASMTKLIAQDITKEFPTPNAPLTVLRDVSLSAESGDAIAIVGPSGSGKSTLLHILGTLDQPTKGTVQYDETDPFALSVDALAKFRNQRIGFVFQEHYLLPQLSLLENVLLPVLAGGNVGAEHRDRAEALLKRVGLAHRQSHLPAELSGGERQRGALARALVMQPDVLLADEPTGNLDQSQAMDLAQMLSDMTAVDDEVHQILILVTHNQHVAGTMKRQLRMQEHQLVAGEESHRV